MGGMGGIQAKAILTGVSARTYFMTLLLAAIGAFFGYLLAQYASDSNNVFTAAGSGLTARAASCARCLMRRSSTRSCSR